MTDQAGATVSDRVYDAWGNLELGADEPGYAFTAREWDPETGLYYYRARYYDPKVGRFISEDPIGFAGGANFFSYAANSPAVLTDPLGLWNDMQCAAARKALERERKYGTQAAAYLTSSYFNDVGDGLIAKTGAFNSAGGTDKGNLPTIATRWGQMEVDWFTEIQAGLYRYNTLPRIGLAAGTAGTPVAGVAGAASVMDRVLGAALTPRNIYRIGKLKWTGERSAWGQRMQYILPGKDPGEQVAVAAVEAGARFADIFADDVMLKECPCSAR